MATTKKKSTTASTNKTSRVTLSENLDIAVIGKLKTKLSRAADRCVDVALHADKIESIDTSALQLLYAFIQCVNANGHAVKWHQPSEALLQSAALSGLSRGLGLESIQDRDAS